MSPERRTVKAWVHHLGAPDAELTLLELMAWCLVSIRDNALLEREATEHTEGMISSLDVLAALLAGLNGLPYDRERAALAEARKGA